nr:G-type lectin S-receptor-like serine/threonine-protein kinase At4g27290 [Ipomoea batatas]
MRTGKRSILQSWTSRDDPRPGKFSLGLDPTGAPQIFIWRKQFSVSKQVQNVPYLRSNVFQFGFSQHVYVPSLGYSVYFTFGVQFDEVYFSFMYDDDSAPIRLLLSYDGHIQILFKPETSNKWENMLQFQFPGSNSQCEMYGSCGSFGSCGKIGSNSVCSCLEGFRPKSEKDWGNGNYSGGCVRRIGLECNGDERFKRLEWMKWPDHPISMGNVTFSECEAQCYRNCSCTAFAYTNISFTVNCINWFGDLVDLGHNNSAAINDLHLRVHASELNWVMASSKSNAFLVGKGDGELLQLSLERILNATNNFDEANQLGEGGFGPVYKGFLSEFGMVAIKRLCKRSSQGLEEFMNELKLIAKLQHKNLVNLLGCCIEDDEKILIYEYLPNRSLDKSLFGMFAIYFKS